MKLTTKQQEDLDSIMYFVHNPKKIVISNEDIEWFFDNSERGLHKDYVELGDKLFLYSDEVINELMFNWKLDSIPKFNISGILNTIEESGISLTEFNKHRGFYALLLGKRWRGIHMQLWEEGVLEGSTPYFILLGGLDGQQRRWWQFWKPLFANKLLPRCVVNFMKKEMFKGVDAKIIEETYQWLR